MADQERSLIGPPQPLTVGDTTGVQFTVAANPFQGVDCDTGRQVIWQNATEDDQRWFNGAYDTFTVWALDLPVGLRAFTVGSAAPLLPTSIASCSTSPSRSNSSTTEAACASFATGRLTPEKVMQQPPSSGRRLDGPSVRSPSWDP